MKLEVRINKIKSIDYLEISLPVDKGLYAITGQNGSGKSTLVTCAATVFFNISMKDFFGTTEDDSFISFYMGGAERHWTKENGKWIKDYIGEMNIKGFYEGSIIFGNRFKNTNYDLLKSLDRISDSNLEPASNFVRENLGLILHNNVGFYEKVFKTNSEKLGDRFDFKGDLFYYQKGNWRVSQFHMSTGENLLISVLYAIDKRNKQRGNLVKPCVIFLDEIELALHPSSLKRLVDFLKNISVQYNYAIYFSTHSIELISNIPPENIFFLERHSDDSIEILNPCYPAYATRILYDHQGYDNIILVEDDLARMIIRALLRENALLSNKLVHVLPCGGYTNVIDLAQEVITSNLVGKVSNIAIILDGDIENEAKSYMTRNNIQNNIPLNFLPIESLEKFLRLRLVDSVDHTLFRHLNDYVFHNISLTKIIDNYMTSGNREIDRNGKKLYAFIDDELRARGRNREELIDVIVRFLIEKKGPEIERTTRFLKSQLS